MEQEPTPDILRKLGPWERNGSKRGRGRAKPSLAMAVDIYPRGGVACLNESDPQQTGEPSERRAQV